MQVSRKNSKQIAINVCLTVIGTTLLAFGTAIFVVPFDLVVGGMSGIAIAVNHLVPSLSVDLIITILTWSLFLLGTVILGKSFALQTLISTIIYPPCVTLFSILCTPSFLGGILDLKNTEYADIAVFIASVFGGVLIGTGCAMAFLGGGSTGGTDVIALSICKIFKRVKSSIAIFIVDASVIIVGLIVIKDLVMTLLGIISVFVSALVIDKIFVGGSKALIAQIVSDNYEEINRLVIERLGRTTTIVDATGGYSGDKKKMIVVSLTMRQYTELKNIINQTDKTAFVTVHIAHEINGEGWTR